MTRGDFQSVLVRSLLATTLIWSSGVAATQASHVRTRTRLSDTLVVRVVCDDQAALRLLDLAGRVASSSRDSNGSTIPGCEQIRPYEDGADWEDGTDDGLSNGDENEVQDTTAVKVGNRGFRIRAPAIGDWRLEATLASISRIIAADVWLNVRVSPRGGILSDIGSRGPWVELLPKQLASCTLRLRRDGSLARTHTIVGQIVDLPRE
jgi:hypothetical protein